MKMTGFWVYTHTTPDGMVYVGRSGANDTRKRWDISKYKKSSLEPFIDKYGWQNIIHEVVKDGLTKEESYQLEDELIRKYKAECICINRQCSGGLQCDGKYVEYSILHRDEKNEKSRKYYAEHMD